MQSPYPKGRDTLGVLVTGLRAGLLLSKPEGCANVIVGGSRLTEAPSPTRVHGPQGCKWMLQRFRQYLASKHGPEAVEVLFSDMDNIFIKSLQSVQKVIISDKHCFELYGYDILIDQDLKP